MSTAITGIVLWSLLTTAGFFVLSRRHRFVPSVRPRIACVVMIPALDEALVISRTVRHLLTHRGMRIVVIDDGSTDGTADAVEAIGDPRVTVLRRTLPQARNGKGEALNDAYRRLLAGTLIGPIDPQTTIVGVVDADGRLQDGTLDAVAGAFADPGVGACQVSVRIRNRNAGFWPAMQHFEFVAFTAVYQRGRRCTGAVSLGGNGQFVRLRALADLGEAPWSTCLTEDLDLGIRLILRGWRTEYLPSSSVSQQGVPDAKRLLRQRTRWFQGSLQCCRHIPSIIAAPEVPLRTRIDLVSALIAPVLLVVFSPVLVLGWTWLALGAVAAMRMQPGAIGALALGYVIAAIPAFLLAYAYWIDEPSVTPVGAIVLGHAFVLYGLVWVVAGWRAIARQLTGRSGWAKTQRYVEPEPAAVAA